MNLLEHPTHNVCKWWSFATNKKLFVYRSKFIYNN